MWAHISKLTAKGNGKEENLWVREIREGSKVNRKVWTR
jgi:hypothetical protein